MSDEEEEEEENFNKFILLIVKLISLFLLIEAITEEILPLQNTVIENTEESGNTDLAEKLRKKYEEDRDDLIKKTEKIEEEIEELFEEESED